MSETLFSCLYGSHLFGTNTPQSDRDEKHIVLPDLNGLLIGRAPKTVVQKTNTKANTRNTCEDVDIEIIPVQVFARDFAEGQTYALELAYALDGTHAEQVAVQAFKDFCTELRTQFLSANLRAMMGYAVNQANIYSFKGERLNVLRSAEAALAQAQQARPDARSLGEVADDPAFSALAVASPKYFQRSQYDIGAGQERGCFILLEKTLPFSDTLAHAQKVLGALKGKYGARANEASESNVDWKAFMHALRIMGEGIELLQAQRITLPRPAAEVSLLMQARRGETPVASLRSTLHERMELLKQLEAQSDWPRMEGARRAEFEGWLAAWMRRFYGL